ncbi:hypothetical protein Tco_1033541 [Tanacetum coccineum]
MSRPNSCRVRSSYQDDATEDPDEEIVKDQYEATNGSGLGDVSGSISSVGDCGVEVELVASGFIWAIGREVLRWFGEENHKRGSDMGERFVRKLLFIKRDKSEKYNFVGGEVETTVTAMVGGIA